jgi:NADPH-dependent 2,4-dienoyl-CoA reductase/sulfur reductase-like enzyme/peroxiredoxin family protein/rhodanese-related sulfurtransferase/TusA-related sulfurtransferase
MSRYVIVGGVAGGATAATRLRRRDETAEIIVLERGEFVSFANCGLPYHIGGVIEERSALLVSTPEALTAEFNLDVRTRHEALRIDRDAKTVEVHDLDRDLTYALPYDKLLLSPGAMPLIPNIPGADLEGVFSLRSIPDMVTIARYLTGHDVRDALVVGGGFIGLEMAENLAARQVQVSLVEMLPQVMAVLDFEIAAMIHRELRDHGVRLGLNEALQAIERVENGRLEVTLSSGRKAQTDMILLAIGVRPESDLAHAAGLELGPRGHIAVNEFMQTSDPDIYAVGDAVQVRHAVTGALTAVPLAGPANRQARIAASHITGLALRYPGATGAAIVKVFDLTAACTGANAVTLERAGIPFLTTINHTNDHVAYYPGAMPQTIKLLYSPTDGKLLGAQAVGRNAVDRTMNTLTTALQAGMTVYDLEQLELVYSPQYGAAKDAVNIAGFVAANRLRGDTDYVEWRDVANLGPAGSGILDVRTQPEWSLGHIPGALHIPNDDVRQRWGELPTEKQWIVYCAIGRRAYGAERVLRHHGYHVKNLSGGYETWEVATEAQSNWETWSPQGAACTIASTPREDVLTMSDATRVTLNCSGMQCPGPIMAIYRRMQEMGAGEVLEVSATDPGFRRDIVAWCEQTGNTLLELEERDGRIRAVLVKGQRPALRPGADGSLPRAKTMIVFSGELDKALAAFVIANGVAATGEQVTMFFTFWGLNILRRPDPQPVRKALIERMFGFMLPKGPDALKLSQLNMGGLGTAMIKGVMKSKNIDSLPSLMRSAQEAGVRLVACQMSMDLMGIKPEELLDGVEVGGVATMLNEADKGNMTLFI